MEPVMQGQWTVGLDSRTSRTRQLTERGFPIGEDLTTWMGAKKIKGEPFGGNDGHEKRGTAP